MNSIYCYSSVAVEDTWMLTWWLYTMSRMIVVFWWLIWSAVEKISLNAVNYTRRLDGLIYKGEDRRISKSWGVFLSFLLPRSHGGFERLNIDRTNKGLRLIFNPGIIQYIRHFLGLSLPDSAGKFPSALIVTTIQYWETEKIQNAQ